MKPHFYPQGAIQTAREANYFVGRKLFMVSGLGQQSYMTEETPISLVYRTKSGFDVMDQRNNQRIYLGDCNIGRHHNHHYLFTNRADAEAYLEWAKSNTPDICTEWWDDDYDWRRYD